MVSLVPLETDEEVIEHITRSVLDNQKLQRATDLYVRAVQGRNLTDKVDDSEAYWDLFHSRTVDMVLRSVVTWHMAPKQEEVVF